jgi:hypothetical protein
MNKVLRILAFASLLLAAPALFAQGGGGAQGGGQGGGGFQGGPGGGGGGQGRGRGGRGGAFVPTGPAGPLAGRSDIYTNTNGVSAPVGRPTPKGEHYYIIGSVDQSQQQILLKKPDEITLLLKVSPDTKFVSEGGKPLHLSDFRAGDTVWVTYKGAGADATAVNVRAGGMTLSELHKYFLDYPVIQ